MQFGGGKLTDELFETFRRGGLRIDHLARALDGFGDARFIKRLQYIIDRVYVEGLHGILIECGSENDVRHFHFSLYQLFQYAEAI